MTQKVLDGILKTFAKRLLISSSQTHRVGKSRLIVAGTRFPPKQFSSFALYSS